MSRLEKEAIIELISSIIITLPYALYLINRFQGETLDTTGTIQFWSVGFLILLVLRITSQIFIHIIFSIIYKSVSKENESELLDERDNLINLKSSFRTYITTSIGFLAAFIVGAITGNIVYFFTIILVFGFIAELIENISKIYFYRIGFKNV